MAKEDVHFMRFGKIVQAWQWLQAPALTGQFPAIFGGARRLLSTGQTQSPGTRKESLTHLQLSEE